MTSLDPGTVVTITIARRDYAGEWTDTTTGPIAYVSGDHIHVNGRWYWTSAPNIRVVVDEPVSSTSEPGYGSDTDYCPSCACNPCECGTPCEHGAGPYDDCPECEEQYANEAPYYASDGPSDDGPRHDPYAGYSADQRYHADYQDIHPDWRE